MQNLCFGCSLWSVPLCTELMMFFNWLSKAGVHKITNVLVSGMPSPQAWALWVPAKHFWAKPKKKPPQINTRYWRYAVLFESGLTREGRLCTKIIHRLYQNSVKYEQVSPHSSSSWCESSVAFEEVKIYWFKWLLEGRVSRASHLN